MAFKTVVNSNETVAWATHECEDYLVVDAYLRVLKYTKGQDIRLTEFSKNWLDRGTMLLRAHLSYFNHVLSQNGDDKLILVHNCQSGYSMVNGKTKSDIRRRILTEIAALNEDQRIDLYNDKLAASETIQGDVTTGVSITASANEQMEERSDVADIKTALLNCLTEISKLQKEVRTIKQQLAR